MPIEISRQNVAALNVESPVGVEVMDVVKGQYRGQTVQVTPESSKLLEAAEEVGMAVASRADRRSLGQRDIRAGRGSSAEALARTKGQYEKLPDMPGEVEIISLIDQLTSFQDRMGSGQDGEPTAEDVLSALQDFDADITHQFAALDIAREHFEAEGADASFLQTLDQARLTFETGDAARDVRAGYASAEVASREAATLETDPATVRDTYRALLRDTADMSKIFESLRTFDPLKNLAQAIDVFTTAAGRDLASAGPSTDPLFLHGLVTELAKLKKVQTTLDATQQLVSTTLRSLPLAQRGGVDTVEQASLILAFASRAMAGPADAQRLLGAFASRSTALQLVYANGLRSLHGEIHDAVFPSAQARHQQIAAIMAWLDALAEAAEPPVLKVLEGPQPGAELQLADGTHALGSGADDAVQFVGAGLAARHALLRISGASVEISAQGGPVFTNGRPAPAKGQGWLALDAYDVNVAGALRFVIGPRGTDWSGLVDRARRATAREAAQAGGWGSRR